jgi:hypothetical protein
MAVFCDLVPVVDARADDRPVFFLITGPEPARAVLFAELLLVANQTPDYGIQHFGVRVQDPAIVPGVLFSPLPDFFLVGRFSSPLSASAGPAAPAPATAPAVFSTGLFLRCPDIILPALAFPAHRDNLLDVVVRIGFRGTFCDTEFGHNEVLPGRNSLSSGNLLPALHRATIEDNDFIGVQCVGDKIFGAYSKQGNAGDAPVPFLGQLESRKVRELSHIRLPGTG